MVLAEVKEKVSQLSPIDGLKWFDRQYGSSAKLSTALGPEAQLLTYWITSQRLDTEIFTIDTGRLFQQTHDLLEQTNMLFKTQIKVYYPDRQDLENLVSEKGPNSFYHSIENRLECCHVRKVLPIKRALKNATVWITGLRADQSHSRNHMSMIEWDEKYQVIKYNPLIHWTSEEVMEQIEKFNIPINTLHREGYVSIGCQPCTRALLPGEDERAGRWWWETSQKECGIHTKVAAVA